MIYRWQFEAWSTTAQKTALPTLPWTDHRQNVREERMGGVSDGSRDQMIRVQPSLFARQRFRGKLDNASRGYGIRVTTPAVEAYLCSLGVGRSDETDMMHREADEVSSLRRVRVAQSCFAYSASRSTIRPEAPVKPKKRSVRYVDGHFGSR